MSVFLRQDRGSIDEILRFIPDPEAIQKKLSDERKTKGIYNIDQILDLDFLLTQVMGVLQPLDWNIFTKNEASQPLKIVATSLNTLQAVVMSRSKGNFDDLSSLLFCIRASMSVPGVTGKLLALSGRSSGQISRNDPVNAPFYIYERKQSHDLYTTDKRLIKIKGKSERFFSFMGVMNRLWVGEVGEAAGEGSTRPQDDINHEKNRKVVLDKEHKTVENDLNEKDRLDNVITSAKDVLDRCDPVCDAFLCEPLPYRSAVEDGATHVIVLRTRPDPCVVGGKGPGVFERVIAKRYFKRYKEKGASDWLMGMNHHQIYAEDVLRLQEGSLGPKEGVEVAGRYAHLLSVAPEGRPEVGTLENDREKILKGTYMYIYECIFLLTFIPYPYPPNFYPLSLPFSSPPVCSPFL
jgi:hypothetical protein